MKDDKELFELCRKCYEATGWKNTGRVWYSNAGKVHDIESVYVDGEVFDKSANVPLYSSDYLLGKLQETENSVLLRWNRDLGGSAAMKAWGGKYCAGTFDMPQGEYPISDTPLKALLKLTLKLHEEKLL
jgi:hypothetical protein